MHHPLPPEWLHQPGQADPDDPDPNQIAVTGVSPEEATYVLEEHLAEALAKAAGAAATHSEPVPSGEESLEEIYLRRAAKAQVVLDQLCSQLKTDNVFPAPCLAGGQAS